MFKDYDEGADEASSLIMNGGGALISIMASKQTQKIALYLLKAAVRRIVLSVFTFDLELLADALVEARQSRGVPVSVLCDRQQALKGSTKLQIERFGVMRQAGVDIWLTNGHNGVSGNQHSKTLLVDNHFIVGSCNWTTNSRQNQEINTLLALNESGIAAMERV